MNWEDLYYIRLRPGSKIPLHAWGGYDIDFEESEEVLTYDDVMDDDHTHYGYIGHKEHTLGVLDIDVHKDVAPPLSDVTVREDLPVIKTKNGGFHVPFLVEGAPLAVKDEYSDWIDLKGDVAKGHAVFPGPGTGYEIVRDESLKLIVPGENDSKTNHETVGKVRDEPILEIDYDQSEYDREYTGPEIGSIYQLLDEDRYPEGERVEHPFHGSSTGMNFMIDEDGETFACWRHDMTGNLVHLLGMKYGLIECGQYKKDFGHAVWEKIVQLGEEDGYEIYKDNEGYVVEGASRMAEYVTDGGDQ